MILNLTAVVLGLALGFALQRGGFCMNSCFRSIVFEKNHFIVRSWVLVLVINLVFVHLLDDLALITISRAPLYPVALIGGGLVFGLGMVLAGGCASGSCYRAGRGMLGSWGALTGFAAGILLFGNGLLRPVQSSLRSYTIDIDGEAPSLWNLLGIEYSAWRWLVIAVLSLGALLWLVRAPKQKFLDGWNWWQTGLVIGVLAVGAWVLSALEYRDFGLSFTQPLLSWGVLAFNGDASLLNVTSFILLGVPLGAFAAAAARGEARLSLPAPGRFMAQSAGGILMGAGASVAGGCNIGHGITGLSTMSLSSMLMTIFTMFGVWLMTAAVFAQSARSIKEKAV